ncbi:MULTISPECIES: uroporphyrinogen-III synthase [Sphingomonas]|uniref:uroporphyrinogen-III synthase n=1 Tax=Sphingomonas TaxID=13687 RepID=UPI0020C0B428|nr:uroporphyrinogen-III synthase [Sphingomonas faeni]MCK8457618.1 uroporphyrinogen-III synthase [Sphingomonas faeni]
MTRMVVVLRPEPGNTRTADALRARGLEVRQVPLFAVVPVYWTPPNPTGFDGLLLTSANAVRHGGAGLGLFRRLPVVAVGAATAAAASGAGFAVAVTGGEDARAVVAEARDRGFARLLHLAGREQAPTQDGVEAVTVYASEAVPVPADVARSFEDALVLVHSARAAARLAELVDGAGADRSRIALVAISRAVGDAAGTGWGEVAIAPEPSDSAVVAMAAASANTRAIDQRARGGDKHAMSDYVPTDRPRARGPRMGVILALVGLAFIAGLALMAYAAKTVPWFGFTRSTAAATTAQQKASASATGYIPSQPLGPDGEPQAAAPVDTAVLATREATLAAQLAALEARTAAITTDASAAGGQATRAEGLMVAFAARRALDRGVGLGYLEEQLRLRFGQAQPRATMLLIQAARQPVTLEDLRQGLDTIAPDITTSTGEGWLDTIQHQIDSLVVLRKAGTPSPMPADRLARVRRLLEAGQVEAARAEVARLPGAAQASNWMDAARRYVTARQALDVIENTALIGQAGQPQPAPVVIPPPVVETTTPDEGAAGI